MLCLDIPPDHRLIQLRTVEPPPHSPPTLENTHIDILGNFGRKLIRDDANDVSWAELDFTLEMARPESTGGLAIILAQPHPSQEYRYGFVEEERRCKTLAAVKELLESTSHQQLTTNMVSIFDAMPFVKEPYTPSNPVHKEAQQAFLQALEAKRPQVVVSCFRMQSSFKLLQDLNGRGIGKEFAEQTPQTSRDKHRMLRISAFHPSFAVNRVPFEGCFRRLLYLEFSQGLRSLVGDWKEEGWMATLRRLCREKAEIYNGLDDPRTMKREQLNLALKTFAKTLQDVLCCNKSRERENVNVASALKESGLTWVACDAGLLLKDRPEDDEKYTQSGTLILDFISILFESLKGRKEHQFRNQDPLKTGFLRHSELLHLSAHIYPHDAEYLFQSSATLLRQLNMTFDPDAEALGSYLANDQSRVSQGNAFLRFAECVEQHLLRHDRVLDRVRSEQTHQGGDVRVSNTSEMSLSARMSQVKLSDANDREAVTGNIVIGNDMHRMLIPERIWRNASQMRSE